MAETRNPFGGNVLPFRRGAPLPEGGGGGFAPKAAPKAEGFIRAETKDFGRSLGEFKSGKELGNYLRQMGIPRSAVKVTRIPEVPAEPAAPRPANRFEEIMRQAPKVPGKPVEPQSPPPPARDFMSRRGEQLGREAAQKQAEAGARKADVEGRFAAEFDRSQAAQAAAQKKAEAMVQRLSKPRPADAEVRAEQGLELARPVAERGRVNQYSRARDASIFHDPVTGVTRVRRGSQSREFASRREALEALQKGDPFGPH